MTEIELLIDLHKDAKQQGPGATAETKKALSLIGIDKNAKLKIADIGCGTGAQTITLAQNTQGHITAVDFLPEFLDKLDKDAKQLGLNGRIKTVNKNMEELSFENESFDIVWAEGAIYNIGFENGVKQWGSYLKKGGFLAVSEISWLTDKRPKGIEDYWNIGYPGIDTISNKIKVLEKNGYSPTAHFILPEYCWLDNYYNPIQKRLDSFVKRNNNSSVASAIAKQEVKEYEMYKKYKNYYSYGFYIAQKL